MTADEFTIFWSLQKEGIDKAEQNAGKIKDVLEEFPHWRKSEQHEREVKQSFYSVLLQSGMSDLEKIKIQKERMEVYNKLGVDFEEREFDIRRNKLDKEYLFMQEGNVEVWFYFP